MTIPRRRPANLVVLAVLSAAWATGCAENHKDIEPRRGQLRGLSPAEADARAEAVRRDPAQYIEQVAAKCRTLTQYTLLFTRYERRGLLQQMVGPEHIACRYRRQPFSLYMKWLDEDSKHGAMVYVAGQKDDKVRFVTRRPTPFLLPPPEVNTVDLQTPVIWGESKHPVTDFGLERLVERTLKSLHAAGDQVVVTYEGLLQLPQTGATVHHLHLAYAENLLRVPIQELYIDVATDLPAGTVLKFASGRVDAAYYYENLDTNVHLTDADFLLESERPQPQTRPAEQRKTREP